MQPALLLFPLPRGGGGFVLCSVWFYFNVRFYCNFSFYSQEVPPAGGVTFSPPKKSPKSRQKPMVSGLPFCPSAPVVRGGPVSWQRCFPCDDLTLPPRSAAALWDVVSGLVPRSVFNVAELRVVFQRFRVDLVCFFYPKAVFISVFTIPRYVAGICARRNVVPPGRRHIAVSVQLTKTAYIPFVQPIKSDKILHASPRES